MLPVVVMTRIGNKMYQYIKLEISTFLFAQKSWLFSAGGPKFQKVPVVGVVFLPNLVSGPDFEKYQGTFLTVSLRKGWGDDFCLNFRKVIICSIKKVLCPPPPVALQVIRFQTSVDQLSLSNTPELHFEYYINTSIPLHR